MRRKPAACSKVLSPRRGTSEQLLARRNGAVGIAVRDDVLGASVEFSPEMRASSGADAVFTSTPTAFTQSSTTASSCLASFGSG
jgi:hypothetical protein